MLSKHRTIISLVIIAAIILLTTAVIFWARGFKPNFRTGTIDRTGLIVATSIPTGAQVYLDDRLTSATNTNIAYLEPKTYKVKIEKDGYTTWTKDVEIKADLATEIKALLFPTAPEIKPLTVTGAIEPNLSPDGTKIVYATPGERKGLYLMPMSDRFFPFSQNTRLVAKNQVNFDFTKAKFIWSPDSKQVIARFTNEKGSPRGEAGQVTANILIDTDKTEQELRDITGSLAATLSGWQEELIARAQTLAITLPDDVKTATAEAKIVNSSQLTVNSKEQSVNRASGPALREPLTINYFPTGLVFSPDEEKVLYLDKNNKYHIYDLKNKKTYSLPDFTDLVNLSWYPDSNHLLIAEKDQISIIESDGTNKMIVFTGKFENGFVFSHPSGTRLIILTALTQQEGTPPNLYSINLK